MSRRLEVARGGSRLRKTQPRRPGAVIGPEEERHALIAQGAGWLNLIDKNEL